jgi:hypothetical protein
LFFFKGYGLCGVSQPIGFIVFGVFGLWCVFEKSAFGVLFCFVFCFCFFCFGGVFFFFFFVARILFFFFFFFFFFFCIMVVDFGLVLCLFAVTVGWIYIVFSVIFCCLGGNWMKV